MSNSDTAKPAEATQAKPDHGLGFVKDVSFPFLLVEDDTFVIDPPATEEEPAAPVFEFDPPTTRKIGLHRELPAVLDHYDVDKSAAALMLPIVLGRTELTPLQKALLQAATGRPFTHDTLQRIMRAADFPPQYGHFLKRLNEIAAQDTGERIGRPALDELLRIVSKAQSIEDGIVTQANIDWQSDDRFEAAYQKARHLSAWGRDVRWRMLTLMRMAKHAARLKGDFVECGVDKGGSSQAVIAYLGDDAFADRRFFLFDTYRGLEPDQLTEEERTVSLIKDERYPDVLSHVKNITKDQPFTRVVPGIVPETLEQFDGEKVAFLHIDMNVAEPEVEALRYFWPKLVPGAPVIFDDYGFEQHGPQRRALNALAEELGVEIMPLPTCQGLLMKPSV
ncbi:TylF/MycF/NovP-related O-methyltransferase [Chachezhania antarctica]|uniref:TylF/MycF/NovP-related O-methyltransferase n=1 Tax=Chachezhania antarctica TaxID=2340860 RepID=UPI000EB58862|nr:TylF/MycF/NovP-related O-methyltransferase [Chachezhania antarctica]